MHVQITGANALAPLIGARFTALDFGKSNNAGAAAANHNLEGGLT